ncbi:MAG: hypothetical protein E2O93_06955 [Alphaproteobacteria bacterium]|nr:MAG: hypothetical protein E2O93_06955 [Alphaproteobacteria bacterium]
MLRSGTDWASKNRSPVVLGGDPFCPEKRAWDGLAGEDMRSRPAGRTRWFQDFWTNDFSIVAYLWTTNCAAMQQIANPLKSCRKLIEINSHQAFLLHCGVECGSHPSIFAVESGSKPEGGILMASLIKPLSLLLICAVFVFIGAILLGAL